MSRCERCGGKDHTTAGHDAAVAIHDVCCCGAALNHLGVCESCSRLPRYLYSESPKLDWQCLLPFEAAGTVLVAHTQRVFKPVGLMLFGPRDVLERLNVLATQAGRDEQLIWSSASVPALWWSTQQSFAEVVKALDEGKQAASWGSWDVVVPGIVIRLHFDGDASAVRAVMWGMGAK